MNALGQNQCLKGPSVAKNSMVKKRKENEVNSCLQPSKPVQNA